MIESDIVGALYLAIIAGAGIIGVVLLIFLWSLTRKQSSRSEY
jgi:uncharacterized protein (DUF2062 family)